MDKRIGVIGENIRRIRETQGYTLEYVAEEADISVAHLQRIETFRKGLSLSCLYRIADALKVYPGILLCNEANFAGENSRLQLYLYSDLEFLEQLYVYTKTMVGKYCL